MLDTEISYIQLSHQLLLIFLLCYKDVALLHILVTTISLFLTATIAVSLTYLTEKNVPNKVVWTEQCS